MRKVFLPKWQRCFIVPLFVLIWVLITYMEFFTDTEDELGLFGYILFSILFLGLAIMMWLMTSGKLPAYMIDDSDDLKDKK